jgi:hypothetical protein
MSVGAFLEVIEDKDLGALPPATSGNPESIGDSKLLRVLSAYIRDKVLQERALAKLRDSGKS